MQGREPPPFATRILHGNQPCREKGKQGLRRRGVGRRVPAPPNEPTLVSAQQDFLFLVIAQRAGQRIAPRAARWAKVVHCAEGGAESTLPGHVVAQGSGMVGRNQGGGSGRRLVREY